MTLVWTDQKRSPRPQVREPREEDEDDDDDHIHQQEFQDDEDERAKLRKFVDQEAKKTTVDQGDQKTDQWAHGNWKYRNRDGRGNYGWNKSYGGWTWNQHWNKGKGKGKGKWQKWNGYGKGQNKGRGEGSQGSMLVRDQKGKGFYLPNGQGFLDNEGVLHPHLG